jgi:DNA-binding transcriptional regulator GbsR (MarR family)
MTTKASTVSPAVAKALSESKSLFIRRWGEMSSYWGINRTMAEIHALLYVSTEPICTDDVMALLQVSRGNASMNLRSLVDWGLIERIHVRGDRKEYFSALSDVWQMFETIMRQRKRREVEPIVETIARCREMAAREMGQTKGAKSAEAKSYLHRLDEMNQFLRVLGTTLDLALKVGPKGMDRITGLMMKIAG